MKFLQMIEEYEAGPWRRLRTGDRYSRMARRILELQGDEVDPVALTEQLRAEGLKAATVNKYLTVLDGMDFKVKYLSPDKVNHRVFSEAELEALDTRVRAMPTEKWGIYQALYAILRDTGCRGISELSRMDWGEVDWDGSTFVLRSFKGRRDTPWKRIVPLSGTAWDALAWLFHNGYALEFSPDRWNYFWRQVRLDKGMRPYDLRHTFCTRLLTLGVDPTTVMQIMGHTNLQQTLEYHHQTEDALSVARRALNGFP